MVGSNPMQFNMFSSTRAPTPASWRDNTVSIRPAPSSVLPKGRLSRRAIWDILPSPSRCPSCGALPSNSKRSLLKGLAIGSVLFMAGSGRRFMGAALASGSPVEQVLETPNWPDEIPYSPSDFRRYDESSDFDFYSSPRFVTHIDDGAIGALTKYYAEVLPPSGSKDKAVLDICSSWISHYPKGYSAGRVSGLGMNEAELKRNGVLSDYTVHDLNTDPRLPYEDDSFDVVTNAVSVDYLSQPFKVFQEIHRVLKPGGLAVMSFSNRCFPTKAIAIWTATGDPDHVWIVGSYFHFSVPGGFTEPKCKDISPGGSFFSPKGDPMYVVFAHKKSQA